MKEKFTPGPWRWELNPKSKIINLCGGKHPFDLTVMDFVRWGMNGARPRVIKDQDGLNLMENAEDFSKVAKGREHHKSWFMGLDHPDLNLIAAAPDLYEALKELVEMVDKNQYLQDVVTKSEAALKKARGE